MNFRARAVLYLTLYTMNSMDFASKDNRVLLVVPP